MTLHAKDTISSKLNKEGVGEINKDLVQDFHIEKLIKIYK